MYLQPLQLVNHSDVYVSGDVTIDPSAIIAPGVILQSSPDSRIIIGAGACLGMGTLLHASHGTLEVEAGATLGVGTLFVGQGKIGANACIGSATTVYNASVNPNSVIAAGSVIGDTSRQVTVSQVCDPEQVSGAATEESQTIPPEVTDNTTVTLTEKEALETPQTEEKATATSSTTEEGQSATAISPNSESQTSSAEDSAPASESPSETPKRPAYGQVYVNQMLLKLFPNNQSVNNHHRKPQ